MFPIEPKRKPAVIFLRNKAYRVRVPAGLAGEDGSPSEWDTILTKLGTADALFHWSFIWSWCQEPFGENDCSESVVQNFIPSSHRTLRGCATALSINTAACSTRGSYLGFRPILEQVFPGTLAPDPDRWADIKDGESIPLGTLYMNDHPVLSPLHPNGFGDIPDYIPGADLRIGRTHIDPAYQIRMIKCGNLFIADRNLIKNISWNDLDRCGLIYGEQTRAKPPKMPKEPKEPNSSPPLLSKLSKISKLPFPKK